MDVPDPRHLSLVETTAEAKAKKDRARRKRGAKAPTHPAASELARWLADYHSWEEAEEVERSEKLIEAKLRVSQGYYDRPEVQEKILRAILRELLPSAAARPAETKPVEGKRSATKRGQPASRRRPPNAK